MPKYLTEPIEGFFPFFFIALLIWSFIWKAIGLWKSARNGQKYWFIAILVVNSIGILEIIYLKFFQRKLR